jgi:hypothetical protein
MLFTATLFIDFSAMAITLWLAFYLLARGFPSLISIRAFIVLLALSGFFLSAFINLFRPIPGTASVRAVLLVIGLATWFSLTGQFIPPKKQKVFRWIRTGFYILAGIISLMLLSVHNAFVGEPANIMWVGRMGLGVPFLLYGIFQVVACIGILYNLLADKRFVLSKQGRFLLYASLLPILAVGYGILALALAPPLPRLVQDLLIFSGVLLLGVSVARYQTFVERRTTLQDFPISALTVLGLSALYAYLAHRLGLEPLFIVVAMQVAILTHSIYDLVREILDRKRLSQESSFRRQLRQLEKDLLSEDGLQRSLQEGLELLCGTLKASGGFIAVRSPEAFIVTTTSRSIPRRSQLSPEAVACEDVSRPVNLPLDNIAWIAPAFEAGVQVAVVGIGYPAARQDYSQDDLDLFAEVADRMGSIATLRDTQSNRVDRLQQLLSEATSGADDLHSNTVQMIAAMADNPHPELVKMVEDGLRQLYDYVALGELPLAGWSGLNPGSSIERGKRLQKLLMEAIEALRPPGPRPKEPLPRLWYNYSVLHDAYVEGVPNREIMARLYISEGTFNRTRRNALRGLARLFLEHERAASSVTQRGR